MALFSLIKYSLALKEKQKIDINSLVFSYLIENQAGKIVTNQRSQSTKVLVNRTLYKTAKAFLSKNVVTKNHPSDCFKSLLA